QRHRLHDVLTAIRHRTTLDGSHRLRHANSERYLKSPDELAELFDEAGQQAMANSVVIAARCQFNLVRDLDYEFPSYAFPPSISEGARTPDSFLGQVCRAALDRKYPMHPCHPEERSDEG